MGGDDVTAGRRQWKPPSKTFNLFHDLSRGKRQALDEKIYHQRIIEAHENGGRLPQREEPSYGEIIHPKPMIPFHYHRHDVSPTPAALRGKVCKKVADAKQIWVQRTLDAQAQRSAYPKVVRPLAPYALGGAYSNGTATRYAILPSQPHCYALKQNKINNHTIKDRNPDTNPYLTQHMLHYVHPLSKVTKHRPLTPPRSSAFTANDEYGSYLKDYYRIKSRNKNSVRKQEQGLDTLRRDCFDDEIAVKTPKLYARSRRLNPSHSAPFIHPLEKSQALKRVRWKPKAKYYPDVFIGAATRY